MTVVVAGPPDRSRLRALSPHTKVAALVLFVLAVVSTPREAVWAHAACAAMVVALALVGRVRLVAVGRRLLLELPFVAFAAVLPFVAHGPRVEVLGLVHVSRDGLWAAWGILAKGTLGLAAASVVVATTPTADLLRGLQRLHVPAPLTTIASFMLRYLEVVTAELRRMQVARISRGDDPRWLGQVRALASTVGCCSCAPSSEASGSTRRCCRGVGTATCEVPVPRPPPSASGRWCSPCRPQRLS